MYRAAAAASLCRCGIERACDLHLTRVLTRVLARDQCDLAIAALMSASAALEKGSHLSAMDGQDHARAPISIKSVARWGGAICALLFLVWVISALNSGMPRAPLPGGAAQTAATVSGPQKTSGVPLSADDFLNRK